LRPIFAQGRFGWWRLSAAVAGLLIAVPGQAADEIAPRDIVPVDTAWQLPAAGAPTAPGAADAMPGVALAALQAGAPTAAGDSPAGFGPDLPASDASLPTARPQLSFGERAKAVKWEVGGILAYMTVTQIAVTKDTESFHFQNEGWFGKDTTNLGIDKLTHAFNSYLLAEFLQARIKRKTGNAEGSAFTAAVLASGLMIYSELYDAHKTTSGFSIQDVTANTLGAAFSVLRNTVPGLEEKLDFRLLLMPNSDIFTFKGKRHYEQQRYLMALQLAGFDRLRATPLRFVELHAGYRATGFTNAQQARGEPLERRIFVGVGLNLNELLFGRPRSAVARGASQALDYFQIPYTAAHVSVTR